MERISDYAPCTPLSPVGFFDSGKGGLSILARFKAICPFESTVYIADDANVPYGTRPPEEILRLSKTNVERLRREYGCKMVVIACNTATAAAIDVLRSESPSYPFVGVEPAVKPAAQLSKSGKVAVLATAGTFGGRLFRQTKNRFAKNVEVINVQAPEFVEMVERGETSGDDAAEKVERRIKPLLDAGCDVIVLGCTHFPHLKKLIEKAAQSRAAVIDPSDAVARRARDVLVAAGLAAPAGTGVKHVEISTMANALKADSSPLGPLNRF